jgi:hypothetical protein
MTDSDESAFGLDASSADALRRQHREARAVLDHQVRKLSELDETALRTARIAVVVLAVVVSATRLSGDAAATSAGVEAGTAGLVATFCMGVFTHGVASADLGPTPAHISEVRSGEYDEREWIDVLLSEYETWIGEMTRVVYWNGLLLQATQLLLACSVLAVLFGWITSTGLAPFP